jgi:hypothetical protein
MMPRDYRDLVIEMFADSEAGLRANNATLIDLLADLTFEHLVLFQLLEREHLRRIQGDAALVRLRQEMYRRHHADRKVIG